MGFLVENKLADDAVRRNVGRGGHYFDADTMRSFGSKVHEGYDAGEAGTIVIMSNRDAKFGTVCGGRRHYYLIIVDNAGYPRNMNGEFSYDVCKETGYWMSLPAARKAAKRAQVAINTNPEAAIGH